MILKTISKAIEKSGKSRYQISKETGIDQAALSRLMRGIEGCISIKNADKLCKYLGLELAEKIKSTKTGKRG